uniref:phosphatidylserine decarboxylase n=1 Tax=Eubacterium cellulosolvens TaxID=29322 RepID=UPI000486CEC5|nr:phosphatidylserine decarboxylase [[Eubacterium] cellulosolvens]
MSLGLDFLYRTIPGRVLLKILAGRSLSKLAGFFLDSPLSKPLIRPFVQSNGIDLGECENTDFRCFNDCFTRKLKSELRPVDMEADHLISPCDGLLSVWPVREDTVLPVKQSKYTISGLLQNKDLAVEFGGGTCLVFRLCVNHYHRYCYPDSGTKGENVFIPGKLHTVRPVALREVPVFTENCREYTILDTDHFGRMAQIEVGAMLVGKILNHHGKWPIRRGQEKGYFLYGGSTIILLLQKNAAVIDPEILEECGKGKEVPVRFGQRIGHRQAVRPKV